MIFFELDIWSLWQYQEKSIVYTIVHKNVAQKNCQESYFGLTP